MVLRRYKLGLSQNFRSPSPDLLIFSVLRPYNIICSQLSVACHKLTQAVPKAQKKVVCIIYDIHVHVRGRYVRVSMLDVVSAEPLCLLIKIIYVVLCM